MATTIDSMRQEGGEHAVPQECERRERARVAHLGSFAMSRLPLHGLRAGSTGRRVLLVALALAALLVIGGYAPGWMPQPGEGGLGSLALACLVYAGLLAIPFVPSVEIGLLIMVIFGKYGAVGAYLATVAGLNLAYIVGCLLRRGADGRRPHLPEAVQRLMERLASRFPAGSIPAVALGLLLNMPANTLLGGGGGIAMAYGASGVLRWVPFTITVALATAVIPGLFLAGFLGVERLLQAT